MICEVEQLIDMYNRLELANVVDFSRKRSLKTYTMHIFVGGELSVQSGCFSSALFRCNFPKDMVQETYITTNDVKERGWSLKQFVSWLLNCDVHFILSHVHQGLSQLGWHMRDIEKELRRLAFHKGFPNGCQLHCPVFLQDKFRYLRAVPHLVNPTLKVPLLDSYEGTKWPALIEWWCAENQENNHGWVVKMPFTTNSEFVKFPRTVGKVFKWLRVASERYKDSMTYALLQPCMQNRKENKVVLLNGKFSHLSDNRLKYGLQYSLKPHKDLRIFCEHAVRELSRKDESFISEGLVRVDVFCDAAGVFRVNEFESLEANYYSTSHKGHADEMRTSEFLIEYWMNQILMYVC